MQKVLRIADAIFKTKQNHVKRIWPLERAPSIYLGYELISKTSKLKLDGFSIDGPSYPPPPWIINTEGHITLNLLQVYRYGHPLSIDTKISTNQ